MEFAKNELTKLLMATTYREFIETVMKIRSAKRRFGYADLSRRAGFASRSFPRDVVMGKKRISLRSVPKFSEGLGIKGDLALLFRLLVEKDHPDCRITKTSEVTVLRKLHNVRARLRLNDKNSLIKSQSLASLHYPFIYAALGDQGKGASINEIMKRTSLDRFLVKDTLEGMQKLGIVTQHRLRFKAAESHLAITGLQQSMNFKSFFLNCVERSMSAAEDSLASEDKLFFASCFSVARRDLPRLKEDLRNVLHKYVDDSEYANGDYITRLCCSLL